jgi:hypothetical protein
MVIGEPCMDYIHRGSNTTTKQLAEFYILLVSLAVISSRQRNGLSGYESGEDEYDNVTGFLSTFSNIDLSYINKTAQKQELLIFLQG